MAGKITFKIITPEGVAYEHTIDQVTLPAVDGDITVLPNHVPIVSAIKAGELMIKNEGIAEPFAISRGVVEVRPKSEVIVLADTAQRAEEIDLAEAEAARARAEAMLKEKEDMSDVDFSRLEAVLDRELARIKVGNKYLRK